MSLHEQLAEHGIGIHHHFANRAYIKETLIPAGKVLTQHVHAHDHLSALMAGIAKVSVDGVETIHQAPEVILIKAGAVHKVESITDVHWLCIHGTEETDVDKVDAAVVL
jgi:quercetin dioxygenase-like cupin family protein